MSAVRRRDRLAGRWRPPRWADLRLRTKGIVVVAIPLSVLVITTVLFVITVHADARAQHWVAHSRRVEQQLSTVQTLVVSVQNDDRGLLLAGASAVGEARSTASSNRQQLQTAVRALAADVSDDSSQLRRVAAVSASVGQLPPNPPSPPTSAAAADASTAEGAVVAAAQRQLDALSQTESALLAHRQLVADRWRRFAEYGSIVLLVVGVLAGAAGVALFTRGIAARFERLEAEVGDLDPAAMAEPPDDSADELGRLSRQLRITRRSLLAREAELRQATSFLENVLASGPMVVLRASSATAEITYVSPNCAVVLGVTPDEALSVPFWTAAVGAFEAERIGAAIRELHRGERDRVECETQANLHGTQRWIAVLITRENTIEDGGLLAFVVDVTARKIAENDAEDRQRQLLAITATSPDIIAVFDADLRLTFSSEATTSVLGRRMSGQPSAGLADSVHADDRRMLFDAVRSVIAGAREDFTVRIRARHASGRILVLEGHGRPLLGPDGAPSAAVAVFRDVTERMALEEQLVEARDEATAASRAKSEFLSRMSHELRTPLNVVLGFTQLLQLEVLGEEQHAWVDQVLRAGRHLLDLINEVLDIARIESGALALSPEPVSLRDVVEETVDSLTPIADGEGITLRNHVLVDDLYVRADRQRLKQVLLNLLSNAVKYNRPHGRAFVAAEVLDGGLVRLDVSDTGIGIAEEHLSRLFVPFDRLGAESSTIEGTGVGLPLSLRLVEAMDGTLTVVSQPGQGSTFQVCLPRVVSPTQRAVDDGGLAPSATVIGSAATDAEPGRDVRQVQGSLLYIEDNLTNLQLMQRVVERRPSVRLMHALRGREGLEMARTSPPDLVLLDLHLPDVNGAVLLGQLRADSLTAHIPVYVVSADATPGQIERMLAAGAAGYLTKPLDVRQLLDLLDAVLGAGSTSSVSVSEGG